MSAFDLLVCNIFRPFLLSCYVFIFETVHISVSRNSGVWTGFWLEAENMIDEIFMGMYVTDCRCGSTLIAALC